MNRRKFNREWIELNKKSIESRDRRDEELLQIRREELYLSRKRSDREAQMLSEAKLKRYITSLLRDILSVDDEELEEEKEK